MTSAFAKELKYVRRIEIRDDGNLPKMSSMRIPAAIPYLKNLKELYIRDVYLDDIVKLVRWIPKIEVLWCENILARGDRNEMLFFTQRLRQLRKFGLFFSRECEFTGCMSLLSTRNNVLPETLEVLAVSNLYDSENYVITEDIDAMRMDDVAASMIRRWNIMEESLLTKYRIFSSLRNLRSLTLGQCRSYTARVWRECFIPCGKQLEFLSLTGWHDNQSHGLLDTWQNIQPSALSATVNFQDMIEDVEEAIADFLHSIPHLRKLELIDFYCGEGIKQGIRRLSHLQHDVLSTVGFSLSPKTVDDMYRVMVPKAVILFRPIK
ncbi:hypothetical protein DFQ28_008906 [Apophysomyces sp. BC1034]|nr:hypothetical protein DFQ30_006213 [Apophysomyces sp. BC1015]KAG0181776.1 hypothetical protein DFQ29_007104 [Apophysomyces sp. BC1021]KAG0192514.1 hypothetical protein DFQ28_008906 [Apophysomyces sp. BC1034]